MGDPGRGTLSKPTNEHQWLHCRQTAVSTRPRLREGEGLSCQRGTRREGLESSEACLPPSVKPAPSGARVSGTMDTGPLRRKWDQEV